MQLATDSSLYQKHVINVNMTNSSNKLSPLRITDQSWFRRSEYMHFRRPHILNSNLYNKRISGGDIS